MVERIFAVLCHAAWSRNHVGIISVLALVLSLCGPSEIWAQSFFSRLVVDPAVGVDRGSAAQIQKQDEVTAFATFDTYGAKDIGPYILGFGYAVPDALMKGDQIDLVGVLAGPSHNGQSELIAGGLGYRLPVGIANFELFFNFNYGAIDLGTVASAALDAEGVNSTIVIGLRRVWALSKTAKVTGVVELSGRHSEGRIFGTPVINEDLRMLRASVLYEEGIPLLAQRRFALSVTKGLDGFGASAVSNPLASSPGATTDFLRFAASAEISLPLSPKIVANMGVVGQFSKDSLPISQRCGYGTNAYARGFDQSFVNGDTCLGARVEMAYNNTLPQPGATRRRFTQTYVGVDFGRTGKNANTLIAASYDEWSSLSVGVRSLRGNFLGEATVTHILDEPVGIVSQKQTRFWVRGAFKF